MLTIVLILIKLVRRVSGVPCVVDCYLSNINVGDAESRAKDVLSRVYEYFLSQFASAEGKKGGEFYTPRCVVKLLVEMLEPYKGRVYDPGCGSSGMFVQSVEFIRAHANGNGNGGKVRSDISIYGQERRSTSTATCSRPAATSAPRRRRTMASCSGRRCGGWWCGGVNSTRPQTTYPRKGFS